MNVERQDPRYQNVNLDWSSLESYRKGYAAALAQALNRISSDSIEQICNRVLEAADRDKKVFVIGNGGSAAVADHLCCDWSKGTNCSGFPVIKSQSLVSNVALYSAIANDFGFDHVFDMQIDFFAQPGDVLIAISSSGNSPNVLNAVKRAKEIGVFVAGFSGFSGGELAKIADAAVHVETHNYGIVEDAHQAVMHIIAQYIACNRDNAQAK